MSSTQQPQTRTRMFARVLGPFLVIVDVTDVVRASHMRRLVSDFGRIHCGPGSQAPLFCWAALSSSRCTSTGEASRLSLCPSLGWVVALRGLFLLAFPQTFVSMANHMIGAEAWWRAVCIAFALVGLYLTYVGWAPASSRPTTQASSTPDISPVSRD